MEIPQIVILVSVAIDLLVAFKRHKEYEEVNAYAKIVSKTALLVVLVWGGFFGGA